MEKKGIAEGAALTGGQTQCRGLVVQKQDCSRKKAKPGAYSPQTEDKINLLNF